MGQTNDIYMVKLHQTLEGQAILNVFFYQNTGASPTAQNIANAFNVAIVDEVIKIQSSSLALSLVEVINLNDPLLDFYQLGISKTGLLAGDRAARFDAWGFQYLVANKTTRSGGKRFAGVDETTTNGTAATAAFLPTLEALATSLETPFLDAGGGINNPVVIRYTGTQTLGYTIHAINPVQEVQYKRLTTQNTRKR